MPERYRMVLPDGTGHSIDPESDDFEHLARWASSFDDHAGPGARPDASASPDGTKVARSPGIMPVGYEPPISAIGGLFLRRLARIHSPQVEFSLDINTRATVRVLGGYYRRRRLVRIYTHDRETGRRPLEELFDTFLHEVAHHLEYTEPQSFQAKSCGRVRGRMHSDLFWRILGELKARWADLQRLANPPA